MLQLTDSQYRAAANSLQVEVAAIKAVAEVESVNSGFLSDGRPVILFEAHIFYRELKNQGINPDTYITQYSNIISKSWNKALYGASGDNQYKRLAQAQKINDTAALCSASWGAFQVMGFHYKSIGWKSVQDFVSDMYSGADMHLHAFIQFVKANNLVVHLKNKDWARFARGYNGAGYAANAYDKKMAQAYAKYAAQDATKKGQ